MYAVEFETNITSQFIELKDYQQFLNKQAKVIILFEDEAVAATSQPDIHELRRLFEKHNEDCVIDPNLNLNALADEVNA